MIKEVQVPEDMANAGVLQTRITVNSYMRGVAVSKGLRWRQPHPAEQATVMGVPPDLLE